jgi:ribosomal protein S18 acetylase RimI-like enzyme
MEVRRPESEQEWAAYFDLRWQVLRAPWNQPRGAERDPIEDTSEHALICDEEGRALAVGRLHFNAPEEGQIRSMATAPHARGQGLGRRIIEHLEAIARAKGAETIVLNARDSAVGFYAKLGYEIVGPGPTLFDVIPHVKMCKRL